MQLYKLYFHFWTHIQKQRDFLRSLFQFSEVVALFHYSISIRKHCFIIYTCAFPLSHIKIEEHSCFDNLIFHSFARWSADGTGVQRLVRFPNSSWSLLLGSSLCEFSLCLHHFCPIFQRHAALIWYFKLALGVCGISPVRWT